MKILMRLFLIAAVLAIPSWISAQTLLDMQAAGAIQGELSNIGTMSSAPYMERARGAANQANTYYQGYQPALGPGGGPPPVWDPTMGGMPPGFAPPGFSPTGGPMMGASMGVRGMPTTAGQYPGMQPAAAPVTRRVTVQGNVVLDAPPGGFIPDKPAQWANQGFNQFRAENYEAGIQFYRQAKDADFKYTASYERVLKWKGIIDNQGREALANEVITKNPMDITAGMYLGWARSSSVRNPQAAAAAAR